MAAAVVIFEHFTTKHSMDSSIPNEALPSRREVFRTPTPAIPQRTSHRIRDVQPVGDRSR